MENWIRSAATTRGLRIAQPCKIFMGIQTSQPNGQNDPFYKILWLLCAFVPCLVAIICFQAKLDGQWVLPVLLGLDVVCSFLSAIGLVRGMKDALTANFLCLILAVLFFVANGVIALLVGCSGMGRIAP